VSDRTRVLHGALQLATFTIEQLAELTGIKAATVQSLVAHSRDLMEVVGSGDTRLRGTVAPGTLYRLRESGRARVSRDAVELAEKLRGTQRPSVAEVADTVTVALDSVESSIELSQLAVDRKSWEERAVVQLELARRLSALVKDYTPRASLRRRVVHLAGRLEGIELHLPEAPPVRAPAPPHESRKHRGPRTIWRSPNRRLFDAAEQRFVTLVDIRKLVNGLVEFVVIDKRGRGDITRSILLQIIADLERGQEPMLSREFLLELIRSYGATQSVVGGYLEYILKSLSGAQEDSSRAR
jgi:polyhydroxyalkanoate synthesis repressor PhaR